MFSPKPVGKYTPVWDGKQPMRTYTTHVRVVPLGFFSHPCDTDRKISNL
jgi:hypothetical protein